MASSKVVMPSSTSTNSDLARQPPSSTPTTTTTTTTATTNYSLTIGGDHNKNNPTTTIANSNFGSMNMDELFRNICCGENPMNEGEIVPQSSSGGGGLSLSRQGSYLIPKNVCNKMSDEVWNEINAAAAANTTTATTGGSGSGDDRKVVKTAIAGGEGGQFAEMTLEDFLERAGAMGEEDVRIPTVVAPVTGYVIDSPMVDGRFSQPQIDGTILGFGTSMEGGGGGRVGGGGGGGRGKRRAVQEPIDKVAQQRQRRMIKNRESAARSRERKQAYTVELETLVTKLEEENAQLLREQEERAKERYKQLIQNLIPIEEKRRPPRPLRRTGSAHW